MPSLTALMAIPGAGKSTWVTDALRAPEQCRTVVVCPDEIRGRPAFGGDVTSQTNNAAVFAQAHKEALEALRKDKDVIWDATNVNPRSRADILRTAGLDASITTLVVLDVPLSLAKQRNAARSRVVPEHVLDRMYRQFVESLSQIGMEGWDSIEFERIS